MITAGNDKIATAIAVDKEEAALVLGSTISNRPFVELVGNLTYGGYLNLYNERAEARV